MNDERCKEDDELSEEEKGGATKVASRFEDGCFRKQRVEVVNGVRIACKFVPGGERSVSTDAGRGG